MAQHKAEDPTSICFLSLGRKLSNQLLNISLILDGPCTPKVKCIIRQRNLARHSGMRVAYIVTRRMKDMASGITTVHALLLPLLVTADAWDHIFSVFCFHL